MRVITKSKSLGANGQPLLTRCGVATASAFRADSHVPSENHSCIRNAQPASLCS